jgi:FkbM family methyltransferase
VCDFFPASAHASSRVFANLDSARSSISRRISSLRVASAAWPGKLRDRFHPLYHLRKSVPGRALLRWLDFQVWMIVPGVDWKVRVRLVSHAGYYLVSTPPEHEVAIVLSEINQLFKPRSFWDVGANIGYYSWFLKAQNVSLEVRMFEPDPHNVHLLEDTMRLNQPLRTVLRPVAVSDRVGSVQLTVDNCTGASSTLEPVESSFCRRHWNTHGVSFAVPSVTIDSERSTPVDLIKIDVEGHEENVFRGASETLRRDQPIVVAECFHGGSCLVRFLRSAGYIVMNTEQMDEDLSRGCNFVALPARHAHSIDNLRKSWRERVAEARAGTSVLQSR